MSFREFEQKYLGSSVPKGIERKIYRRYYDFAKGYNFIQNHMHLEPTFKQAEELADKLIWNKKNLWGDYKPESSNYSWFPYESILVVEKGTGWFHDYLRENINYHERGKRFNSILRSGHICESIQFPNNQTIPVALFDSLSQGQLVNPAMHEFFMVMTLAQNNILSLTNNGHIVKLIP